MNKVGYVYSTTNYEMFKKLEGNREVFEQRKKVIMESIRENGWIRNPIVINEKMEIIDGQGRYEALKELKLPIEYVIAEGADIATCIALNVKQKNWNSKDYIDCYAETGNVHYSKLKEIIETYGFGQEEAIIMAGNGLSDCGTCRIVKGGEFKIIDEDSLNERLEFMRESLTYIEKTCGRRRSWVAALKMVFYSNLIDNKIFIDKLKKYNNFIVPCVNVRQVLGCFEKVYNYHSQKDKIYFVPEYEKWIKK